MIADDGSMCNLGRHTHDSGWWRTCPSAARITGLGAHAGLSPRTANPLLFGNFQL
jgi:hypothetical protein